MTNENELKKEASDLFFGLADALLLAGIKPSDIETLAIQSIHRAKEFIELEEKTALKKLQYVVGEDPVLQNELLDQIRHPYSEYHTNEPDFSQIPDETDSNTS